MQPRRAPWLLAASGLTSALAPGCTPPPEEAVTARQAGPGLARAPDADAGPAAGWAATYALPAAPSPHAPDGADCGERDAALSAVAEWLAQRLSRGEPIPEGDEVTFEARRRGGAFVGLRWWTRTAGDALEPGAEGALTAWAAAHRPDGRAYCGVARADAPRPALVGVAADARSTLEPLPSSARLGQWVELAGETLVEAQGVRLVVLDPAGPPRGLTVQRDGRRWRVRALPRSPGPWLLQLLIEDARGPLPALEALLHVGTPPPDGPDALPVAGEAAALGSADEADALTRMASAARQGEGLSALAREPGLDALAVAHAMAMRAAGRLGHDVGGGDPTERATAAGIVGLVGENVARARTAVGAHRAWWRSPSHRGNLLDPRFRRVGAGVARGDDGALWAVLVLGAGAGDP